MSREHTALFKRRCCHECGTVTESGEITVTRGNLTLDRALRRASWKGQPVRLTPQCFSLLELLVQREGRVVQTWSFFITVFDEDVDEKQVDVQVCKMRKAFRSVDPDFDQLETIRGEGFLWRRFELVA